MVRVRTVLAAVWFLLLVSLVECVPENLELSGRRTAGYSPSNVVLAGGCAANVEVSFASDSGVPHRGYIDLEFACSHFDCSGAVLGDATAFIEFTSPFKMKVEGMGEKLWTWTSSTGDASSCGCQLRIYLAPPLKPVKPRGRVLITLGGNFRTPRTSRGPGIVKGTVRSSSMDILAGPSTISFQAAHPGQFRDALAFSANMRDGIERCEDMPAETLPGAPLKILSFHPNTPGAKSSLMVKTFTTGNLVKGDHIRLELDVAAGLRSTGNEVVIFKKPAGMTAFCTVLYNSSFVSSFVLEVDLSAETTGGSEVELEIAGLLNPQSVRPPTLAVLSAYGSSKSHVIQRQTTVQCPAFIPGGINRRQVAPTAATDFGYEGNHVLQSGLRLLALEDDSDTREERKMSILDFNPSIKVSFDTSFPSPWNISSGDVIEWRFPENGYTLAATSAEVQTNFPNATVEWLDGSRVLKITVLGNSSRSNGAAEFEMHVNSSVEMSFKDIETPPFVIATPFVELALLQSDFKSVGTIGKNSCAFPISLNF